MKRVDDEETVQVFSFSEIGEGSTKIPHFLHIEKVWRALGVAVLIKRIESSLQVRFSFSIYL